jgi:hypothetical protein
MQCFQFADLKGSLSFAVQDGVFGKFAQRMERDYQRDRRMAMKGMIHGHL